MELVIQKILSSCLIKTSPRWKFSKVSGDIIYLVGIRAVPNEDKIKTLELMEKLLIL